MLRAVSFAAQLRRWRAALAAPASPLASPPPQPQLPQRRWFAAPPPDGDLYAVLGAPRDATRSQLKAAFRRAARATHPDARPGAGAGAAAGGRPQRPPAAAAAAAEAAAAEFLRVVAAYEVLSDPDRRRAYDAALDGALPGPLRAAAAAAAAAGRAPPAGASAAAAAAAAGPDGWRYGLGDWARRGGGGGGGTPQPPARRAGGGRGVLDALERYRGTLETDLHSALLHAFFGPRLDGLAAGELPPAFEAEERASPDASDAIFHIVSGRTLLGAARLRRRAALAAGEGGAAAALPPPDGGGGGGGEQSALQWVARAAGSLLLAAPAGAGAAPNADGPAGLSREQLQQLLGAAADALAGGGEGGNGAGAAAEEQAGAGSRRESGGGGSGNGGGGGGGGGPGPNRWYSAAPLSAAEADSSGDSDSGGDSSGEGGGDGGVEGGSGSGGAGGQEEEFEGSPDARWREALLEAHRLREAYDWAPLEEPPPPPPLPPPLLLGGTLGGDGWEPVSAAEAAAAAEGWREAWGAGSIGAAGLLRRWEASVASEAVESEQAAGGQGQAEQRQQHTERQHSEQQQQQQAERHVPNNRGHAHAGSGAAHARGSSTQEQQQRPADPAPAADGARSPPGALASAAEGLAEGFGEALRGLAGRGPLPEMSAAAEALRGAAPGSGHPAPAADDAAASAAPGAAAGDDARPRRRRPWRRLLGRGASGDWRSCSWAFDDASGGAVTVVEALVAGPEGAPPRVVGVGVRDESQEQRPVKVYVRGELAACLVEGAITEPFSGAPLARVHRSWTPGVSFDIWIYRPSKPQPRLLCRMRRSWLPPSGAWLFPPRDPGHDVGGWLIEWEGAGAAAAGKPGALPSAVFVVAAALYSLDAEGARRQGSWLRRGWRALAERLAAPRRGA
ncbi:hypothetical protein Rsub_07292 [Raphidocelis subcapitata]|uniref:J domain-containing protein n=1 Tax=Raphidocelis subcapitata TaxID=307507 RepID=A0A2V0P2B7_9CHLO|nr:hypothetical protein Rsub_07292 [Raphidocelis subcapitata]|eukprot:GBF94024.1 hypothetical protein Rsub_07292 [Raphidocelis subcapitata]